MIIDTHAHYAPQAMLDALKSGAGSFPSVELLHKDDKYRLSFAGRDPTRPLSPKLRDAEQRLAWMGEQGIDHQVTSGWLDSFGYELPAAEGAAWSRFINEHLISATAGSDKLTPLGSVPLQDGKMAAEVLSEALEAGFPGVMIGTLPFGGSGNLDDPTLDPFWQTASDLGATVFIHPMFGCGDPRLLDYEMMNAVGRGTDTTTAVARLLFSGHFLKYTGMKVVLPHGGGALPYMLGRLIRNYDVHRDQCADPAEGMRRVYFDSIVFDADTLRYLRGKFGAGRIMLGSDYPFPIGDLEPVKVVREAGLEEIEVGQILGETAARIFRVETPCGCQG
ncbi:MAG: amidohydrolase [Proteobacteria bacterium]|nr:amidohydrolase [Pseudomonadota bacterium]